MNGLHGGNDIQVREAMDIIRMDNLDMLDAVAKLVLVKEWY